MDEFCALESVQCINSNILRSQCGSLPEKIFRTQQDATATSWDLDRVDKILHCLLDIKWIVDLRLNISRVKVVRRCRERVSVNGNSSLSSGIVNSEFGKHEKEAISVKLSILSS